MINENAHLVNNRHERFPGVWDPKYESIDVTVFGSDGGVMRREREWNWRWSKRT